MSILSDTEIAEKSLQSNMISPFAENQVRVDANNKKRKLVDNLKRSSKCYLLKENGGGCMQLLFLYISVQI